MESVDRLIGLTENLDMNKLHKAVRENRIDVVRNLVKNGADVSAVVDGYTPLHLAAKFSHLPIMEALITRLTRDKVRELINTPTYDTGNSVLHLAAQANSIECVLFCLCQGADYTLTNHARQNPYNLSTLETVTYILGLVSTIFQRFSDPENLVGELRVFRRNLNLEQLSAVLCARNHRGYTTLQEALDLHAHSIIATIIDYRIEVLQHLHWRVGATLDCIASQSSWEVDILLDKLLEHSRKTSWHLNRLQRCCQHDYRQLAIKAEGDKIYAERIGEMLKHAHDFLETYRSYGNRNFRGQPNLVIVEEVLEYFEFYHSEALNNLRILQLVKHRGLKFAVKLFNFSVIAPMLLFAKEVCSTVVLEAAKVDDLPTVEKYLNGPLDPYKLDESNWTALHYAIYNGNISMTKLLLGIGVDPTLCGCVSPLRGVLARITPRMLSRAGSEHRRRVLTAIKLHLERVEPDCLVFYLDSRYNDGSTALHMAARMRQKWLLELLLSKGATYCVRDRTNRLPEECDFPSGQRLFRLINDLFILAQEGNTNAVLDMIRSIPSRRGNTIKAVTGARNDQGLTLNQVLDNGGHQEVSNVISWIVAGAHWSDTIR